jgi:hypothetical protein
MIFASQADLVQGVYERVVLIANDISLRTEDSSAVTGGPQGNYTPPPGSYIYFWEPQPSGTNLWSPFTITRSY